MTKRTALEKIAARLRVHSLRMTTTAGSGHPSTCLSAADIAAVLFFDVMRYDVSDPGAWGNDEFVLSKGHAAPLLWAAYAEAGILPVRALLDLRKVDSDLEGHPTPRIPWVKAATGSLGQGLSIGVGLALAQRWARSPARTFVLLGDGECAEGQVWEAANSAALLGLKNLVAVVDVNRLGQSQATMHGKDAGAYARKFRAFGWDAAVVDGHKIEALQEAFRGFGRSGKPTAILAKTVKGKGVSFLEDRDGWHGKPLKADELARALEEVGCLPDVDAKAHVRKAPCAAGPRLQPTGPFVPNAYQNATATRLAFGNALASLGKTHPGVVAIDGDVKNSTYTDKFFAAFPERSVQAYIAEQNMAGIAAGLAAKGYVPFLASFAAFLTRAHDQFRMAAYSRADVKVCGSHVGVSIGEDGPSQMGLEDLALFRSIPGCAVLYPGDAFAAEACVAAAAAHPGLVYIRTSRPATPLLYSAGEEFPVGGCKVLRKKPGDAVTVVAAGVTLAEAVKAAEALEKEGGPSLRIVDAYSVQPLDAATIAREAGETGGRVLVVEDHYPAGGLGEAVFAALDGRARVVHLCVRELPRSGKPAELVALYGIDADAIARAARDLARR